MVLHVKCPKHIFIYNSIVEILTKLFYNKYGLKLYFRSEDEKDSSNSSIDLHTVNIESETFKNLPVKEKYDILMDLKETRKQSSWGRLHELPKKSDNFSDFQVSIKIA